MNDFNFLIEPVDAEGVRREAEPEVFVGPNLDTMDAMTPKQFAVTILEVYRRLGGASWLFTEAKSNPRAFLELLKKMIPSGIQMKDLAGFSIRLIDQFGNQIILDKTELEAQQIPGVQPAEARLRRSTIEPPSAIGGDGLGQPDSVIATGGNPDPKIKIKDTFDR